MPPQPPRRTFAGRNGQGSFTLALNLAGPRVTVVPCTARFVGPNYKNQEGLAPDVVGGELLFGRSFVSFPFRAALGGRWG